MKLVRGGRAQQWQTYHVVIIEEAQGRHAVIIPIDPHHGLRGSRQGVLQIGLPGLILVSVGELLEVDWVILQQPHRPETEGKEGRSNLGCSR